LSGQEIVVTPDSLHVFNCYYQPLTKIWGKYEGSNGPGCLATLCDIDSDGKLEVITPFTSAGLYTYKGNGDYMWSHGGSMVTTSPLVADITGDNTGLEIIYTQNRNIIALRKKIQPCPTLYTWTGSEFEMDNSLLRGSGETTDEVLDYYKLKKALVEKDGVYPLEIREFEGEDSYFDKLNFLAVDHPADVEVGVTADGIVFPYTVAAVPTSAVGTDGQNYAVELSTAGDGEYYQAPAGTIEEVMLRAEFTTIEPAPEAVKRAIRIDVCPKPRPLEVQVSVAGETITSTSVDLRRCFYAMYIPLETLAPEEPIEGLQVTLYLNGLQKVDAVQIVNYEDIPILVKPCSLLSADYSYGGSLKDALLGDDNNYANLIPGETIELSFSIPEHEEDSWARDFIMVSNGYYVPVTPPKTIIETAITELEEFKSTSGLGEDAVEKMDNAITHLQSSLNEKWWIDDSHLNHEDGEDVFDLHKDATENLAEDLIEILIEEYSWTPDQIATITSWIKDNIIKADKLLALIVFAEVQKAGIERENTEEIVEKLQDAYGYIVSNELVDACETLGEAWEEAIDALGELAEGTGGAQSAGDGSLPRVFSLSQNYPNPFTSKTQIQFTLPRKSHVKLSIYDVSGRLVKTLVNGERKPGYYSVKWDAKEFPSGIYFAKFNAGDYKAVKKLILMR
ncbi:T9SS type A sorting domain-containing protein, partial [candidate division WOR-3 bacterium]|nr:T9SS type A sorting domain-containing protein [candidate division WOR-3 bacterium]